MDTQTHSIKKKCICKYIYMKKRIHVLFMYVSVLRKLRLCLDKYMYACITFLSRK